MLIIKKRRKKRYEQIRILGSDHDRFISTKKKTNIPIIELVTMALDALLAPANPEPKKGNK